MNAIKAKFGPKKYHQNLLGEALEDLLRKATAKNLEVPDEIANAQVVQAINEDAVHSPKEIAALLKKRLEMDNPQKQFLAVELVGKVLRDCQIVAPHQEEVLQSVAAVMTRPGRNSPAAQRARGAARELLRSYGRSGYDAIRQAARTNYAAARQGAGVPPQYAVDGVPGAPGAAGVPTVVEKASLVDEVVRMVEAARGHTELLQDMLVNSSEPGMQEFERDLMQQLLSEVRELRSVFTPYLEQLGALEGPEVEKAMCDALEAVDMLDNAIALQRDVAVELAAQPPGATGSAAASPKAAGVSPVSSPTAASSSSAAAASSSAVAAAATSSSSKPAASAEKDLIDLSDLGDSLPPVSSPTPQKASAADPFKDPFTLSSTPLPTTNSTPQPLPASSLQPASASNPLGAPPTRQTPQQPAQLPSPQLTAQSPFPNYAPQGTPNSPGYSQQQPYPMQQQMALGGFPSGGVIGSPTHSPPAFSPPMSPTNFPYGGAPMMPQQQQQQPPMYPMMHMQVPQQPMGMYPGMPPPNMSGPQMGMVPQQMPYMQPPPMGFQDNAFPQPQQLHVHNSYNAPVAMPHNPNNPFATLSSPPAQQGQTAVDKEWDMLFTDKGVPQTATNKF